MSSISAKLSRAASLAADHLLAAQSERLAAGPDGATLHVSAGRWQVA